MTQSPVQALDSLESGLNDISVKAIRSLRQSVELNKELHQTNQRLVDTCQRLQALVDTSQSMLEDTYSFLKHSVGAEWLGYHELVAEFQQDPAGLTPEAWSQQRLHWVTRRKRLQSEIWYLLHGYPVPMVITNK